MVWLWMAWEFRLNLSYLPAKVLVVHMSNKQGLGGESIGLDIYISSGDLRDRFHVIIDARVLKHIDVPCLKKGSVSIGLCTLLMKLDFPTLG